MTAIELLKYEAEQVGDQIGACVEGLSEAGLDVSVGTGGMSIRQTLEHLCEAYEALLAHCEGRKYKWGVFEVESSERDPLLAQFHGLRSRAIEALPEGNDELIKAGYEYVVAHDNYHVGQMVRARLAAEPNWNSNSIYAHH